MKELYEPNEPYNRASEKALATLNALLKHQVRYLVFGSFSIDAYHKSLYSPKIRIWIDTHDENLALLNKSLSDLTTLPVEFIQEKTRLVPTIGLELPFELYSSINGFKKEDFNRIFTHKKDIVAISIGTVEKRMQLPHLSLEYLYYNIALTPTKFREKNMEILYNASLVFQPENPLLRPLDFLKTVTTKKNTENNTLPFPRSKGEASTGAGFKSQVRDFNEIRGQLDLEVVLQHYGYQLATGNKPNSSYRVYKPKEPDSSQRISVLVGGSNQYNRFIDLNNDTFKGDCISFIKQMEQGDWKRIFEVIDGLLMHPEQTLKVSTTPVLHTALPKPKLRDEARIQLELFKNYQVQFIGSSKEVSYLIKHRSVNYETIMDPLLAGQIFAVRTKSGKVNQAGVPILFRNVSFPLTSSQGNVISLDIRGENFKTFPEGSKGDAIWKTNTMVELVDTARLESQNGAVVSFPTRTKGIVSKLGLSISNELFKLNEGVEYKELHPHTIVLTESPIDGLSFQQLNPPEPGEYRLLLSSSGNPSSEQTDHITSIFEKYPKSQIVVAADSDQPGIRFAINFMGLDVHSRLKSVIKYHKEIVKQQSVWYNKLSVGFSREISVRKQAVLDKSFLSKVQNLVTNLNQLVIDNEMVNIETATTKNTILPNERMQLVVDSYEIRIPNDHLILARAAEMLAAMSNHINQNNRLVLLLPDLDQKDLNEILQSRNGLPFTPDMPLYFTSKLAKDGI